MTILAIVLGFAVFLLAGDVVGCVLAPSSCDRPVGRLGFALVFGPGIVAFVSFVANVAGVRFGTDSSYAISFAFLLVAALLALRSMRRLQPARTLPRIEPAAERGWTLGLTLVIVLPALLGFVFAAVVPPYKDAIVNWSYKTLILWHDGSVFSDDFLAKDRHLYHPNYPLLVPIAQVFLYGLAGEPLDAVAKGFLALPHLGLALLLFATFSRRMPRLLALTFAALVAATPHFYKADVQFRFAGSVPSGYGDPMFTALVGAIVLSAIDWLDRRRRGDLLAAALGLGLAIFTKNEAIPLVVALGAGMAIAILLGRMRGAPWPEWRTLGIAALIVVLVALPWLVVRHGLPERDENYQDLLTPGNLVHGAWRLPLVLLFAAQSVVDADTFGMIWPLLLVTLIVRRRHLLDPGAAFTFVVLTAMSVAYALVFVVAPLPIVDSLVTSIPRTFFHMSPLAVVLAARLIADDRNEIAR